MIFILGRQVGSSDNQSVLEACIVYPAGRDTKPADTDKFTKKTAENSCSVAACRLPYCRLKEISDELPVDNLEIEKQLAWLAPCPGGIA